MKMLDRKRIEWEVLDSAFRACIALRDMDLSGAIYGFVVAAIRTSDMDTDGKAIRALEDALRDIRFRTERAKNEAGQ